MIPITYPVATATCCREWPVALGVRMGRCKFCGEGPVIAWPQDAQPPVVIAPPVVQREVVE